MPGYRNQKPARLPSIILGLTIFFVVSGNLCAQEVTSPLIKSGLIHKFAQHIVWPQEEAIDTFRIGVFGEEPELMSNIMLLESFDLKGKPISIKKFDRLNDITGIHLLYLSRDANSEIQKISKQIAGTQTLLVSDRARNQNLIMINFLPMTEGKAEFEVNKVNITNEGMDIAPDLLLLGGTEIDVVGLFKQSQQAMERFKGQIDELSESFKNKSKLIEEQNEQIEEQNQEIEKQKREFEIQKQLYEEQARKSKMLQEEMDTHAEQLAKVLEEVEAKQQTLDSKIELISEQEGEISNQRAEIENRNSIL
ncbi:MAG: YfiR/HmsC family protein, partial [Anaerolineales bacterium]|nr:YfiR/HmsC family protein [Anaerolineales bacterium]